MKEGGFITQRCAFCGKDIDEVNKLVKSSFDENIYICDKCSRTVMGLIQRDDRMEICKSRRVWEEKRRMEREKKKEEAEKPFTLTPHQIHRELDRFIIGQEQAKKVLSVAVYNHMKRLSDKTGLIKKSNILPAGPSGTGKTLFASTIARMLDVPFAILDATAMTPAGYIGNDVEICLQRLLEKADGDASLAEKGIIYIDEIDKLAGTPDTNSGFFKENTQASLLKMVEGCEVPVPINGKIKYPNGKAVTLNTRNILFICGGAFPSLTGPGASQKPIRFQQGTGKTPDASQTTGITHESLIEYGMMQELAGRLPVIVTLNALQEKDLLRILTEPEDAITKEYKLLFEKDNVILTFEEDALKEIAGMALAKGTGARELRAILEDVLLQAMYDLPEQDISECIITKKSIHTKIPTIVKRGQTAASVL